MVSREQITTLAAGGVAIYGLGRLTGLIGGGEDTADPVSESDASRGDRNTTGSDPSPQITPRAPGLADFIERQRSRSPTSFEETQTTQEPIQTTTQATETDETMTAGGGGNMDSDTATTGDADTMAGDDRQAVAEPGSVSDGSDIADLFSGGLRDSGPDRNVTGEPGSTTASDDRTQTQRPDTRQETATTTSTQRPDQEPTFTGNRPSRDLSISTDDDDDDDRSSSSSASEDTGGSSVADSFSGGLSSSPTTER